MARYTDLNGNLSDPSLHAPNKWGNLNRWTDSRGGQHYTAGIVIDNMAGLEMSEIEDPNLANYTYAEFEGLPWSRFGGPPLGEYDSNWHKNKNLYTYTPFSEG